MPAPTRSRSRHWQWLLIVPTVAPLLTPYTNRIEPRVAGVPFFFWYQLACALLAMVVITFVHLVTRGDDHE
ncbi:hypothetical protein GCM10010112_83960 [Actinoplanes lobatus]|uniref:Putative membrane protein YhdT n=1 Tax=Actinoplanes lobatus TaxID=113568 RepID=A0A7W7HIF7_9ACTN|nr:DUF3311 domain-containing protein [Actinoplanes lobatus]MBB4751134.1 putative membrane protein YhdT [Actinoplanes lobatus]GGN94516.1 hypothetical protein GCM10010112_83960 [Actinoplanes lobatus]GIE44630.1 hypothetical protein Alo02nite_75280 [Actinoplanes lobatus]